MRFVEKVVMKMVMKMAIKIRAPKSDALTIILEKEYFSPSEI